MFIIFIFVWFVSGLVEWLGIFDKVSLGIYGFSWMF